MRDVFYLPKILNAWAILEICNLDARAILRQV